MVVASIPEGIPKSGRVWKVKQLSRASAQLRCGLLKNQTKTLEERNEERQKKARMLELQKELREDTKRKKEEEKNRILEKRKRVMEAEMKNTSYQAINAEKLKTMSKKQLRMVRKTSMNKNGSIELVNPWERKK